VVVSLVHNLYGGKRTTRTITYNDVQLRKTRGRRGASKNDVFMSRAIPYRTRWDSNAKKENNALGRRGRPLDGCVPCGAPPLSFRLRRGTMPPYIIKSYFTRVPVEVDPRHATHGRSHSITTRIIYIYISYCYYTQVNSLTIIIIIITMMPPSSRFRRRYCIVVTLL